MDKRVWVASQPMGVNHSSVQSSCYVGETLLVIGPGEFIVGEEDV